MTQEEKTRITELKAGLEFIAGQRITSSYQVGFKIDSMRDKAEEILPLLDTLAKELKEAEAAVLRHAVVPIPGGPGRYCQECTASVSWKDGFEPLVHKPDCIVTRIQAKGDTGGTE